MTKCIAPACKWRSPGECVYYSGDFISGYNITDGDNLNVVVQKLTSFVNTGGGGTESPNIPEDSNSVDMSVSGAFGRTIRADIRVDNQVNNKLTVGLNGLYVAPATFSTSFDAGVLSMTIDGTTQQVTLVGGVSSVFGRTGAITAQAGDYNWSDIGNKPSTLAGLGITDPVVVTSGSYNDPAWITALSKSKVGLANVQNIDTTNAGNITSGTLPDARISAAIARLDSPALIGTPTGPTASTVTNNTQLATTAFVHNLVSAISSGVTSFNGRSGTVVAATNDYTWAQINKATSSFADITTRSASDINSGTLNDARLSSNIPRLDAGNTFTGTITLSTLAGVGTRIVKASSTGVISAGTLTSADVGLGNVPNVDTTNPANIVQNPTYRFVTDTEKSTWNGKQDALGFTPVPNTRTVNGLALSANISLSASDIGLGNVPNIDATNATNITSGTLPDARLSSNIPKLNTANIFTSTGQFTQLGVGIAADSLYRIKLPVGTTTADGIRIGDIDIYRNASTNLQISDVIELPGIESTGRLHALLTTEQLRLSYDMANYFTVAVDANALVTFNTTAGSGTPTFSFSDMTLFPSGLRSNTNADNANLSVTSGTAMGSTAHGTMQMGGAVGTIRTRITERGNTGQVMNAGDSYIGHIIGAQTITEATSGVHAFISSLGIKAPIVTDGTATTTITATLYVEGAATGVTPTTGAYAVWVDSGDVRIDSLAGTGTRMVVANADGVLSFQNIPAGTGDVTGPASATDNALIRADGTTGKIIQNSVVTLSDTGALAGITTINGSYPVNTVTLTSDVTSSGTASTWSNITGLTFNATAGQLYRIEAYITFSVDATSTGTKWAVTGPASPTILNYHVFHGSGTGFNTTWTNENLVTYDDGIASNTSPATTGNSARLTGVIMASSTGAVTLRMWAETSSGATAKANASYLLYQRLL
jgi:hypothetical protein